MLLGIVKREKCLVGIERFFSRCRTTFYKIALIGVIEAVDSGGASFRKVEAKVTIEFLPTPTRFGKARFETNATVLE